MKLEDLGEITAKWIQEESNKPLFSYFNRGFFKTKDEVGDLHQSFSPYKVPHGLTKLQVRRRVIKFAREGRPLNDSLLHTNRITLLFNGALILGASTTAKRPESSRQMNKLLRDLLAVGIGRLRAVPKDF